MKSVFTSIFIFYTFFLGVLQNEGNISSISEKLKQVNQKATFEGTWETNWGDMVLYQKGDSIIGNYTHVMVLLKA